MNVTRRFLVAELAWAAGIFLLMLPVSLLDADPGSAERVARWLARAIALAAFPAGITIAPLVLASDRWWHPLLHLLAAAGAVALAVFVLDAFVAPLAGERARTLPQLAAAMNAADGGWESRNDAAWRFYVTLLAPLNALLFAAIGVQVGIWARQALPVPLRRALYWAVGIGLLVSGYAVFDTTYEAIVIRTAADTSFAAFYTVLIPASLCAGLGLPTLALLRRAGIAGNTG
ncbi:MAG TPA: hypothetical protein VMM18_12880 [Gemmatimonadaceae bacterium]|nr:hypothetical protein [Gemmatimonadaceae bacterium]